MDVTTFVLLSAGTLTMIFIGYIVLSTALFMQRTKREAQQHQARAQQERQDP
jgi:hypothetical protein